jgi:hypothetical protein
MKTTDLFDDLVLMSEGQLVYWGPAGAALEHFGRLGLHCPQHYNPAEFLIDQVRGRHGN